MYSISSCEQQQDLSSCITVSPELVAYPIQYDHIPSRPAKRFQFREGQRSPGPRYIGPS
jgi:hypothetical protein